MWKTSDVSLYWLIWNPSFTTSSLPIFHWLCLYNVSLLYKSLFMKSALNNKNVHNINSAIMGRVQLVHGTKKKATFLHLWLYGMCIIIFCNNMIILVLLMMSSEFQWLSNVKVVPLVLMMMAYFVFTMMTHGCCCLKQVHWNMYTKMKVFCVIW
jgi:hypothetical protein